MAVLHEYSQNEDIYLRDIKKQLREKKVLLLQESNHLVPLLDKLYLMENLIKTLQYK
jgi:hypothetical protein